MSKADPARIAQAEEHVRKGLAIVASQRALIERVRIAGKSTGGDEDLLALFERTLVIFEQDLERLRLMV